MEELWDKPLFRLWDCKSGSQPLADGRMKARACEMELHTRRVRQETLRDHANYRDLKPTPYISFTDSKAEVRDLVWKRSKTGKRGDQTLVVIDPRRRFELGLPILRAEDEMRYYDVADPYGRDYQYYRDQYLCLWEVTPEEIIGTWDWNDLSKNEHWYDEVVIPALETFRQPKGQTISAEDLVIGLNSLTIDPVVTQARSPPSTSRTPESPSPSSSDSEIDTDQAVTTHDVEYGPSHRHERPGHSGATSSTAFTPKKRNMSSWDGTETMSG